MKILSRIPSGFAIVALKFYQWFISPVLGTNCRFAPTCSQYAIQAIQVHGLLYGGFLAVKRILRCHPWHEGGHDPVPPGSRSPSSPT